MNFTELQNLQQKGKRVLAVFHFLLRRMNEQRLNQVASSLSFTSVLALVPLLVVMLSVLTGLPVFEKFQKELQQMMLDNLMPEKMSKEVMKQINQFAARSSQLSLAGGLSLVTTSLLTMSTVDRAFNDIWHVKRRGLLRKNVLVYWAVLTAGPILFALVLVLSRYVFDSIKNAPFLNNGLMTASSFLLAWFAFTALYMFVPNRKVRWHDALIGALVAAILFVCLTQGFAYVFHQFQVYAIVYSAFSILPAFFLWLYVFWWIVMLGASLTASLPILKFERWRKEPRVGDDLPEALMILYKLYQVQHSPARMISWESLQTEMKLNSDDLSSIMGKLQTQGWVGKIRRPDDGTGWALICDTSEVSLAHLYDVFVFDSQYHAAKAQQEHLPWASRLTDLHRSNYHQVSLSELFEKR
ncbi:YihY family inner membrane protein [Hydromonas duriensis]|uniref:tRNA-processing RNAse BN n=1 Tax=Hydromonas duriensis TaxID=1527608 RepID=A0A4R6YB80_9BURK|nr:YihY family inner membrane protein [Hydromonas duriensis]TDR32828.1 tRNA-processing RNAse BN [Hydromonas duriensis]